MNDTLHPTIASALAPFAPQQQQYRSTCGWRRTWLSSTDADQYDRGYMLWPDPMPDEQRLSTPLYTGWFDADHDALVREEMRMERAHADLMGEGE